MSRVRVQRSCRHLQGGGNSSAAGGGKEKSITAVRLSSETVELMTSNPSVVGVTETEGGGGQNQAGVSSVSSVMTRSSRRWWEGQQRIYRRHRPTMALDRRPWSRRWLRATITGEPNGSGQGCWSRSVSSKVASRPAIVAWLAAAFRRLWTAGKHPQPTVWGRVKQVDRWRRARWRFRNFEGPLHGDTRHTRAA